MVTKLCHQANSQTIKHRSLSSRSSVILIFLLTLFISACQSTSTINAQQAANFRQLEVFLIANRLDISGSATDVRNSAIRDWGRVNDQALILSVAPDKQVLVTLREPCENLARARTIGFERTLGFVVPDPMGNGFDIRETFSEYLSAGDRIILAQSEEELDTILWQQMGSAFGQLGDCTASRLYYLQPLESPDNESEEHNLTS